MGQSGDRLGHLSVCGGSSLVSGGETHFEEGVIRVLKMETLGSVMQQFPFS